MGADLLEKLNGYLVVALYVDFISQHYCLVGFSYKPNMNLQNLQNLHFFIYCFPDIYFFIFVSFELISFSFVR